MITMPEKKEGGKKTASSQEAIQSLIYQYKLLGTQAEGLQKQGALLAENMEELEATVKALNDLKNLKSGEEIMVPLGSGSFATGSVGDVSTVLINIGAEVLVKKRLDDAIGTLEKRRSRLEDSMRRISQELSKTQLDLAAMEAELQRLMKEEKG